MPNAGLASAARVIHIQVALRVHVAGLGNLPVAILAGLGVDDDVAIGVHLGGHVRVAVTVHIGQVHLVAVLVGDDRGVLHAVVVDVVTGGTSVHLAVPGVHHDVLAVGRRRVGVLVVGVLVHADPGVGRLVV